MNRSILTFGCAAALLTSFAAEAKDLRIENKREVVLTHLIITAKNGTTAESFVLVKNLAAGGTTAGSVPRGNCLFDVKGVFADESTLAAEDMDLCSQRTLRLVK